MIVSKVFPEGGAEVCKAKMPGGGEASRNGRRFGINVVPMFHPDTVYMDFQKPVSRVLLSYFVIVSVLAADSCYLFYVSSATVDISNVCCYIYFCLSSYVQEYINVPWYTDSCGIKGWLEIQQQIVATTYDTDWARWEERTYFCVAQSIFFSIYLRAAHHSCVYIPQICGVNRHAAERWQGVCQ